MRGEMEGETGVEVGNRTREGWSVEVRGRQAICVGRDGQTWRCRKRGDGEWIAVGAEAAGRQDGGRADGQGAERTEG